MKINASTSVISLNSPNQSKSTGEQEKIEQMPLTIIFHQSKPSPTKMVLRMMMDFYQGLGNIKVISLIKVQQEQIR